MRFRLRKPRELAHALVAAARRDRDEVADYLELRPEEWEALVDASPSDAADVIEQLRDVDAADLISDLEPADAAQVLEEISPELAAEIAEHVPLAELTAAISQMPSEAAADLIGELDAETTADVLAGMDEDAATDIRILLAFPTDSAGGLMTTEVATLPLGLTTGEAIERIRQFHDEYDDLSYVFVVDDDGRLEGVISFRDLVFRRPGSPLADVMIPDPVAVTADVDRERVAELSQRYHLLGVPVVDEAGRLLGMVSNEAVIEAIHDEATEDFAAAVGAGIEETVYTGVTQSVRGRLPWLLLNLSLALVVAFVVEQLTGVVSREPVLAALMPVVATLGGNSGQQSLAVVIRAMARDPLPSAQLGAILGRQARVGMLNGLVLAILAMSFAYLLVSTEIFKSTASSPVVISVAMGLAVVANLTIASVAGSAIPMALQRLGMDPALASTIFLTLITDAMGFGGFLLIATALL